MQSPEVKQTANKTVADIYNTVIVNDFYGPFKHHAEKDAEQSRCQNTAIFHAVDDSERSREVAVQPNLAALVLVQLDNHAEEVWWSAKALHDHPQFFSTYRIKRFGHVHKCYIQSFVLLPAFLLELSEDEHHVCGAVNPH